MIRLIRSLCLAVVMIGPAAAGAAERVAVRVGEHPGFSRLAFDWRGPVGARLEEGAGQVTIHFDRAAEIDLRRYKADRPPGILDVTAAAEGTGTAVVLSITKGAKARLLNADGVVAVDILQPDTPLDAAPAGASAAAGPPQTAGKPPAEKPGAAKPSAEKATAKKPAPVPPPAAKTTESVPRTPVVAVPLQPAAKPADSNSRSAPIPLLPPALTDKPRSEAPAAVQPQTEPTAATPAPAVKSESAVANAIQTAPKPKNRPLHRAPPAKPDVASGTTTAKAAAVPAKPAVKPGVSSDERAIVIDMAPAAARSIDRGVPVPLRFEWPQPVAAAVYRRGASLWLAFDRAPPGDMTRDLGKLAPQFGPFEQFTVDGATLIRMASAPTRAPVLRQEGTAWVVDLWAVDPADDPGIDPQVDGGAQPVRVSFAMADAGRALSFVDPELGDRIVVVPVTTPGRGVTGGYEYPQFRALPTYQGLVIQPLSDGLEVAVADGRARVGDSAGLEVSYGATLAQSPANTPAPATGPRLLDPAAWRLGGPERFLDNKQALQDALTKAPPEKTAGARMTLARFYFGHGLAAESLGVLILRETDEPRLAMDPQGRLMKGISEFLTDDYESAAKDLFDPSLEGEWEAQLWHAAFAAASHDWAVAARTFARTEPLIAAYPHAVRTRLRLLAAEANLEIADTEAADRYLTQARKDDPNRAEEAQVAFLVGRRLMIEGSFDDARAMWQRVIGSRHAPSQTRARVALLDLDVEQGKITPAAAAEELERLRFAWRGDRFEFALLQRLGDLYLSLHQYRNGLRALRQATTYFPGSERAQTVAQRMRDVFFDIYLGNAATEMAPLPALALYEEFKELTPPGSRGDEVIARLADRLVEVDLLDRAAELLTAQVRYRLNGEAKARTGARLAMIRLLDRSPGKAIEAIEISAADKLPDDLTRERRHLRVRALSELGRYDSALAELQTDADPEALRLRADILWSKKDWPAAAVALQRLLPETPPADKPLADSDGRNAVDLAIALTLAGEDKKLVDLGRAYGDAMQAQPNGKTFALLVGGAQTGPVKSVAEELAQVAQAREFMSSFRERLQAQQSAASK